MIRRRKPPAVLWAALLLLGCAWLPGLHAGPFDGYLVHPQSYLDVVRPAAAAQEGPAPGCGGAPASCSLQGATLEPAPAGPAATSTSTQPSSSSDSISSIKGVFPAGIRAAANPARLQPPYNVCVSSWAPMVRCTPGAEQSEYQGRVQSLHVLCLIRLFKSARLWDKGPHRQTADTVAVALPQGI